MGREPLGGRNEIEAELGWHQEKNCKVDDKLGDEEMHLGSKQI